MKTKAKGQTEYTKREQEHVDASRRIDAELYGKFDRERDAFFKRKAREEAKAK